MSIEGSDERWENWLQFTQARLVPKFTEVLHRLFLFCFSPIAAEYSSHRKPHSLSLRITFPPCILLVLYNSECYLLLKTQSNIHFSPLYSLLPILHILRSPMCILYVLHFFSFLPSSIPSAYSSFILFDFLLSLFSSFIISFPFLLSILYIPLHLPCSTLLFPFLGGF